MHENGNAKYNAAFNIFENNDLSNVKFIKIKMQDINIVLNVKK